jgi:hypothetical protein
MNVSSCCAWTCYRFLMSRGYWQRLIIPMLSGPVLDVNSWHLLPLSRRHIRQSITADERKLQVLLVDIASLLAACSLSSVRSFMLCVRCARFDVTAVLVQPGTSVRLGR